jgi:putative ABC transport system permease protein
MLKLLKIAARNLARFHRRTLLTSALITLGIVSVLSFVSIAGSFKAMMIGQFTDSVLGHLEVHRRGYVASIDTLPLNLNMTAAMVAKVEGVLGGIDGVEAYSERIKLGAMFSNFNETTSIRINGVDPQKEPLTTPLLPGRIIQGRKDGPLVNPGDILIPVLIARGMNVKVGDTVVLVATNREGSVNGKTFTVSGIMDAVSGPSGRDGYIHIADATTLLRLREPEISEIAIRLKDPRRLDEVTAHLIETLSAFAPSAKAKAKADSQESAKKAPGMGRGLEVHTWADLSPFSNIARMIDLLALFIKIMLVSIVLISVMNVMMMAVYERIREIGMISAIGTLPGRILGLFLTEGLLLGAGGAALGVAISLGVIYALQTWKLTFSFGQQQGLVLSPSISAWDVGIVAGSVIVVALLASLQPAWKASRMDPVRALGHV